MKPFSNQKYLNKNYGSNISFSQEIAAQNSTCEHSRLDNHQGLTCTFGHPTTDETTISVRSNKYDKRMETTPQLQASQYSNDIRYQYSHSGKSKYKQIQMILKSQNINLKQQNQLLLQEIYRLKTGNKRYKDAYHHKKMELQKVRQQCEAQKKRGDDIMNTMMEKLFLLEKKLKKKELDQSSCSLLDILNEAEERLP